MNRHDCSECGRPARVGGRQCARCYQRRYRDTANGKRRHNDAVIRYNARHPALNQAFRELRDAAAEATVKQPFYRKIVRFSDYVDRHVPALRWLDDHSPEWLKFPSWAFVEMVGVVYLIVCAGIVVAWVMHEALG